MICPMCGTSLGDDPHGNRRFCSDACRDKARRLKAYNLTPDDFKILVGDGKCPICSRKMKKPHIDHDHETGEVYGAVCAYCNERVLGHLAAKSRGEKGLQIATALVQYLQSPPARVRLGGRYVKLPKGGSIQDGGQEDL